MIITTIEKIIETMLDAPIYLLLAIGCLLIPGVLIAGTYFLVRALFSAPNPKTPLQDPNQAPAAVTAVRVPPRKAAVSFARPSFWLGTSIEKRIEKNRAVLARRDLMSADGASFHDKLLVFINNQLVPEYGERFRVLVNVPTGDVVLPTAAIQDELAEVIAGTRIDYLICVRDSALRPAVAILIDDGAVCSFDGYRMIRAEEVLTPNPISGRAERLMGQASALMAIGVKVYFAAERGSEAFLADNGAVFVMNYLEGDIERALNDIGVRHI